MPESIDLNAFPPPPKRKTGEPRLFNHTRVPTAHAKSSRSRVGLTAQICALQVASWIRYFQKAKIDGRIVLPEVHEAIAIKLAHIAAGGEAESERELRPELCEEIRTRDGGLCRNRSILCAGVSSHRLAHYAAYAFVLVTPVSTGTSPGLLRHRAGWASYRHVSTDPGEFAPNQRGDERCLRSAGSRIRLPF